MRLSTKKIELLLASRGMSKLALSEASGISRQSVSTIIRRGTCEPTTAGKIAKGLNVNVTEIIKED